MVRLRNALLGAVFFLLGATASPISGQTSDAKPFLGVWQEKKGRETTQVLFEPARFVWKSGAAPAQFFRVSYEPGVVILHAYAHKVTVTAKIKNGMLLLTWPGAKETRFTLHKIAHVPVEMTVSALPLRKAEKISTQKVTGIKKELARRLALDQKARELPGQQASMEKVDSDNTNYLSHLVKEVGWIDTQRFGTTAATAAFVLIQHSGNLSLMQTALPIIQKEVMAKRLGGQFYALLYDRLQIMLGFKQRYGTQIANGEEGQSVVLALEDRSKVDTFRKRMGLPPLADYLKSFMQDGKPAVFEPD